MQRKNLLFFTALQPCIKWHWQGLKRLFKHSNPIILEFRKKISSNENGGIDCLIFLHFILKNIIFIEELSNNSVLKNKIKDYNILDIKPHLYQKLVTLIIGEDEDNDTEKKSDFDKRIKDFSFIEKICFEKEKIIKKRKKQVNKRKREEIVPFDLFATINGVLTAPEKKKKKKKEVLDSVNKEKKKKGKSKKETPKVLDSIINEDILKSPNTEIKEVLDSVNKEKKKRGRPKKENSKSFR